MRKQTTGEAAFTPPAQKPTGESHYQTLTKPPDWRSLLGVLETSQGRQPHLVESAGKANPQVRVWKNHRKPGGWASRGPDQPTRDPTHQAGRILRIRGRCATSQTAIAQSLRTVAVLAMCTVMSSPSTCRSLSSQKRHAEVATASALGPVLLGNILRCAPGPGHSMMRP